MTFKNPYGGRYELVKVSAGSLKPKNVSSGVFITLFIFTNFYFDMYTCKQIYVYNNEILDWNQ